MRSKGYIALVVILSVCLSVVLSGCGTSTRQEQRIRIADQFGLGYAPFTIMMEEKLIEKHLPGIKIETAKFGSGGAVREAMVAGTLDIGFMGIPPFLIGWDKGVRWKIAGALDSMPLLLLTYRDDLNSIKDFKPGDKIALPGPGSNQHILLSMAAESQFGDATALDDLIVAMPHPDAAAALLAHREISAYYGAPPFQFEILKQDKSIRAIADGTDAFGEQFSYIIAVAAEKFQEEEPKAYNAFVAALEDALTILRDEPQRAAEILARADGKVTTAAYADYVTWEGVEWDITPKGIMRYATFMQEAGYIKNLPQDAKSVLFPNLHDLVGP